MCKWILKCLKAGNAIDINQIWVRDLEGFVMNNAS